MGETRRPWSVFSLAIVRPCFFFNAPDIAPRTLCACQASDLLICSMVAPCVRRSIASSRAGLVFGFAAEVSLRFAAPLLALSAGTLFFLLIMTSVALHLPASLPAPHALLPVVDSSSRRADHAIANIASAEPFHGSQTTTIASNPCPSGSQSARGGSCRMRSQKGPVTGPFFRR